MHSLLHWSWSARVCICIDCNLLHWDLSQREWHTQLHCSLIVELQSGVRMWSTNASLQQPTLRCTKNICRNTRWCASFPDHWGQLLYCSLVKLTTAFLQELHSTKKHLHNTFTSLSLCLVRCDVQCISICVFILWAYCTSVWFWSGAR